MFAKLNFVQFAACAVPFLSSYRINQGNLWAACAAGGLKWTRTTDLTLIRRTL